MPTPETLSTDVSGILGECHSFWREEEENGHPITRIEEQDLFEIIQSQLTMYLLCFIGGAIGLFLLGWDEEADVKFGGRRACYMWYRQKMTCAF